MHNWLGGAYVPEHTSYWHKHTHAQTPTYSHEHTHIDPTPVLLQYFSLFVCYLVPSLVLAKSYFLSLLSLSLCVSLSFFFSSLTVSLFGSLSPCVSLSPALTLVPNLSLFFSRSVVCPQVEYNSYLPRGVMNGRPLLKCLSITFECLLSLTSEWHTRWARIHKQAHTHIHMPGTLSVCGRRVLVKWYFPEAQWDFFLTGDYSVFWWFSTHRSWRRGAVGDVSLVILQHHIV